MGSCCSRVNHLEDVMDLHFRSSKLHQMDYDTVKNIIQMKLFNLELKEEFRMKISGKNLNALESSLNKISKENFIKLAETYFIDNSDIPSHIQTQKIYFEKLCEYSQNNRNFILFYLLSQLKNDKEKLEKFYLLIQSIENTQMIKYLRLKNIVKTYVKNNILISSFSLKESLEKQNKENFIVSELEDNIKIHLNEENLNNFVTSIFEDFERSKFQNCDDFYMDAYVINESDLNEIFKKLNPLFFNFNQLRIFYLNYYS